MTLLHQSAYFAIYQCERKRCFQFAYSSKRVALTCCQLLALRNRIENMDLEAHFDDQRNPHGLEILTFCNRQHLLLLNTYEVIDLKHLMKATFDKLFYASEGLQAV